MTFRILDIDLLQRTGCLDAVLACGDLPYTYMEYISTQARIREAYYVHGNHDAPESLHGGGTLEEPGGWRNIDRRSVALNRGKLLIAGLEGSIRYTPRAAHQYSELDMRLRAQTLIFKLWLNKLRYGRYLDVLIAHSPARGIHDSNEGAHRGFATLRSIIERYRPRLFLHGHQHQYGPMEWHTRFAQTEVVNVHPFRLIELDSDGVRICRLTRGKANQIG